MIHADLKQIHTDFLYSNLTYKVRGAIFNVYNGLGFGHKEQVYQKALAREFEEKEIPYKREKNIKVSYKGDSVGDYRPDFIVNDKVIIEIKALDFLPKTFEAQLLHYLKTTDFNLGLLVNFGAPKLQIKRLIWTPSAKIS
ncbi:MAG: GxxExxY protein [Patescibacteria group bacterium]|nr:GxxExxY protein [Patescibacteria group bacterium]